MIPTLAKFPAIGFGGAPSEIMFMPAGEHEINAQQGGKAVTARVIVDPSSAAALQASLDDLHRTSSPHKPFFDFDHKNEAASGWPLAFAWRETPEPGVYVRVEWSKAGVEAIQGKTYRAFSPSFYPDATGRVTGCPMNAGGLVNTPAFRTIAPIWSKEKETQSTMTQEQFTQLTTAVASIAEGLKKLGGAVGEIQAKLAAPDIGRLGLETRIAALDESQKVQGKQYADDHVRKAVEAGKIPPKCQQLIEHWTNAIMIDPTAAKALEDMPANPVLRGWLTQQKAVAPNDTGLGTAVEFAQTVQAKFTELKERGKAIDAAIAERPASYRAWRAANGKPGLEFKL